MLFRALQLSSLLYISYVAAGNTLSDPGIAIALAPPILPLPSLTTLVDHLETRRANLEHKAMATVQAAYDSALTSAKVEIDSVVGARTSFLKGAAVKVKVMSSPGVASASLNRVEQVEGVREASESKLVSQAAAEFNALSKIVIGELKKALTSSFIMGPSDDVSVQVKASRIAFPTVMEVLRSMQYRRDASEYDLQRQVVDMQLKFVKTLNGMIAAALRH